MSGHITFLLAVDQYTPAGGPSEIAICTSLSSRCVIYSVVPYPRYVLVAFALRTYGVGIRVCLRWILTQAGDKLPSPLSNFMTFRLPIYDFFPKL